MELLPKILFLCLALALTNGAPMPPDDAAVDDAALPDRCEGIEFDAVTPDEKGNIFYFKGSHLWNGFHGAAQLSNESFKELDDIHHIGHVDAAFRMHNADNPGDHDHIYFFLDDKVFSYYNHTLEDGYPKEIQEDFPGIPSHLDSAVECPKGECMDDSVLFFKGQELHVYDINTKTVKNKTWPHLPVCTSALRWLEHHYCFHGHNFTVFNPVTGVVTGPYPKDIRNYFMKCEGFGHGGDRKAQKCSEVKIDAIAVDDAGKSYSFTGSTYMRLDTRRGGLHAFPITRRWKEVSNGVDAAFSHGDDLYLIKDDHVYIYKTAGEDTLIEGYPKTLLEELSIEGHVDAAFVCPTEHIVHVIQGNMIRYVNLIATPRNVTDYPLPLSGIDAALCNAEGIQLFKGSQYYKYATPMILSMSRIAPHPLPITNAVLGCQDE